MNNKGFTLVELMAVLVLISIIATIGTYSIMGVRDKIKEDMWNSKVDLIENSAIRFGEDNKVLLKDTCTIDGMEYNTCKTITVQVLLNRKYINTKDKDDDGNKVIINDTKEENDEMYYVNDLEVNVYIENDMVYAKLITT